MVGAHFQEDGVVSVAQQKAVRDVQDLDHLLSNFSWTEEEVKHIGLDPALLRQWADRARELCRDLRTDD